MDLDDWVASPSRIKAMCRPARSMASIQSDLGFARMSSAASGTGGCEGDLDPDELLDGGL